MSTEAWHPLQLTIVGLPTNASPFADFFGEKGLSKVAVRRKFCRKVSQLGLDSAILNKSKVAGGRQPQSRHAVKFMSSGRGAVALFLLSVAAGCSDPGRSNKAEQESALKPIARFYGVYVNLHQGKPPRGENEFKAFLKEAKNAEMLKAQYEITDIDKMLISPRDNKPFVIFYGAMSTSLGPGGAPVVGYEKEGVKGKRFVASAVGAVEEVDESTFRKMVSDAR
ncbi:MAG: hypothetical protein K8R36_21505 [Planctomycetales bacterium]|nr:hypothetical protein [Planctomycetales bacterium]